MQFNFTTNTGQSAKKFGILKLVLQQDNQECNQASQDSEKLIQDEITYETQMNALYQDGAQYQEDGIKSFGADNNNRIKTLGFLQKYNVTQISLTDCYNVTLTNPPTQVTKLIVNFCNINSLEGLQDMINLKFVDLSHNDIENLSVLGTLKYLESLYIGHNKIKLYNPDNISSLKNLTDLKCLGLNCNNIQDISSLIFLLNLEKIVLSNNQISDISVLKTLISLKEVDLSYNSINNFYYIKYLINLKKLSLGSCNLIDISFLKTLTNLQDIYMEENMIVNISALKGMNLNYLNLMENRIRQFTEIENHNNFELYQLEGQQEATPELLIQSQNLSAIFNMTVKLEALQLKYHMIHHNFVQILDNIQNLLSYATNKQIQLTNNIVNFVNYTKIPDQ
ncbi:leucine-rich_repeat domain-containing protein [Hexamita inflata]|uniref:Leucine-rich repeat domain-containing protein n=1 Tax=Hexamita inflata TaxID=28002 RepID=A0AA86NVA4_9EUKA|nr:leucine-rich repeat domain-containing protein [Hexamita inflata]CAI9926504.1 leucine-rich repeat domain-containing protein [Hexamita inflata]CAI9926511.1 leucine-rich repeat domain-containing protein [Hexamita inflata]